MRQRNSHGNFSRRINVFSFFAAHGFITVILSHTIASGMAAVAGG